MTVDPDRHLEQQRANKSIAQRTAKRTNGIGRVLKDVLGEMRLLSRMRQRKLHAAWREALADAPGELAHTRIVKLNRGELTVEVNGAARMQEYTRFRAPGLVEALTHELGGKPPVLSIRFVLGNFPAPEPPPAPTDPVDVP